MTNWNYTALYSLFELSRSEISRWRHEKNSVRADREVINYRRILEEERSAVIANRTLNEENRNMGYRKFAWKMIDSDIVYLSEMTIFRILSENKLLGKGFKMSDGALDEYKTKPISVHQRWHTDIAYVVIRRVHYYLVIMLDGYSRYLLNWELMVDMTGKSVELFTQRTLEKYPEAGPMIIHDNGSQFISKDFKNLLFENGCLDIKTKVRHPWTNGKAERFIGLLRQESLRVESPSYYAQAQKVIEEYVEYYNKQRYHSGIKYLKPVDVFTGRDKIILEERQEKLKRARLARIEKNKEIAKNLSGGYQLN